MKWDQVSKVTGRGQNQWWKHILKTWGMLSTEEGICSSFPLLLSHHCHLHTDKRKQRKTPNPYLTVTPPNYTKYSCLWNHKNNNFIIWFSSFIIGSRGTQTMRYQRKQSKFFKLPLMRPTLRTQSWIFFLDLYCLTLQTVKTLCKL